MTKPTFDQVLLGSVITTTLLVLIGWMVAMPQLTTWSGPTAMVPMTGLCILAVCAVEILLRRHTVFGDSLALGLTAAVFSVVIGLLIDKPVPWFFASSRFPDLPVAYSTTASLAVFCFSQWHPRFHWLAFGTVGIIVLISWSYPLTFGERLMAWPTMVALLELSVLRRHRTNGGRD